MNEMNLKFSKIITFSNQYKILEIQKCFSIVLTSTFDILKLCALTHKLILESVLKLKNVISSLQTILNHQAE